MQLTLTVATCLVLWACSEWNGTGKRKGSLQRKLVQGLWEIEDEADRPCARWRSAIGLSDRVNPLVPKSRPARQQAG